MIKTITLADQQFCYKFYFPGTERYFTGYLSDVNGYIEPYELSKQYLRDHRWMVFEDSSLEYLEFFSLLMFFSDLLLSSNRCIFHGTAFLYKSKVWILAGPSGIGKTTQYRLWKELYPETQIINGDKPILLFTQDDTIKVYPSPWNGKENYHSFVTGNLGGIIYLKQGDQNEITLLSDSESVIPVFQSIIYSANTEEEVSRACRMVEQLVQSVPVWQMTNRGDKASAKLAHDTIFADGEPNE